MNSRACLFKICPHEAQVHLVRWNYTLERLFDTRSPPVEHYLGPWPKEETQKKTTTVLLRVFSSRDQITQ